MANTTTLLAKRAMVSRANRRTVVATSVAAFVIIFCLVASKSVASEMSYQSKVIKADKSTLSTLNSDLKASADLSTAYDAFLGNSQNLLGGNPAGNGNQDGNNGQLVLNALPSQYDFPALVTSIEKLISNAGLNVASIGGTDEILSQTPKASNSPTPIAIPYAVQVTGTYAQVQSFVSVLEHSIRPMQVLSISLSGSESNITANISVETYYQPATTLSITKEAIK